MAKRILKCTHADTEDTLIIEKGRKCQGMYLLQQATLVQLCKGCQVELNYYVAGGILFNAKNDNT
jgi:hypothetical protein